LSTAQRAVQATHAGITAARDLLPDGDAHPNLVILTVPDEESLVAAAKKTDLAGIAYRRFIEDDLNRSFTAFATEPINGPGRKHFRDYKLLE
jgi:hypothetical protein